MIIQVFIIVLYSSGTCRVPQYIATDKFFEGMHITTFSFITRLLYKFFEYLVFIYILEACSRLFMNCLTFDVWRFSWQVMIGFFFYWFKSNLYKKCHSTSLLIKVIISRLVQNLVTLKGFCDIYPTSQIFVLFSFLIDQKSRSNRP